MSGPALIQIITVSVKENADRVKNSSVKNELFSNIRKWFRFPKKTCQNSDAFSMQVHLKVFQKLEIRYPPARDVLAFLKQPTV